MANKLMISVNDEKRMLIVEIPLDSAKTGKKTADGRDYLANLKCIKLDEDLLTHKVGDEVFTLGGNLWAIKLKTPPKVAKEEPETASDDELDDDSDELDASNEDSAALVQIDGEVYSLVTPFSHGGKVKHQKSVNGFTTKDELTPFWRYLKAQNVAKHLPDKNVSTLAAVAASYTRPKD